MPARSEMPAETSNPDHPIQYAEAGQPAPPAPTEEDYEVVHGTYRAAMLLTFNGVNAVPQGVPVPTTHPHVLDGTWSVENGCLVDAKAEDKARLDAEAAARGQ